MMEALQELLAGLKQTLVSYDEAEREARKQLEQVVQGRLMQAGAVRGVEMAIETMQVQQKRAAKAVPDPNDERLTTPVDVQVLTDEDDFHRNAMLLDSQMTATRGAT